VWAAQCLGGPYLWVTTVTLLKDYRIIEEITKFCVKYRDKITHPNELTSTLLEEESRRLKRFRPTDLTARFS
jgi:hypothetical protein